MPILLIATILLLGNISTFAQSGKLTVTIEGIKNNKGQVGVLLFNQAQGFPQNDKNSVRQELIQAKKGTVSVSFDNLPHGTYAITVMHDENTNLKLDTNLLGIPKEGYGFSNNTRNLFRAPRFGEAAFNLNKPNHSLTIDLIY